MKFATRKYRAPYGLEQVEMRQERRELNAAGSLYVALTEEARSRVALAPVSGHSWGQDKWPRGRPI